MNTPQTPVQQLVDAMLDTAEAADPRTEHSITLTPENSLLLPIHATELPRIVDGVDGAYRGTSTATAWCGTSPCSTTWWSCSPSSAEPLRTP